MTNSRSPCSVLVGRPTAGPGRCPSTITTGVSVIPAGHKLAPGSDSPQGYRLGPIYQHPFPAAEHGKPEGEISLEVLSDILVARPGRLDIALAYLTRAKLVPQD